MFMFQVSAVERAVDFAQRNGDVSDWTLGHGDRRGAEEWTRTERIISTALIVLKNLEIVLRIVDRIHGLEDIF